MTIADAYEAMTSSRPYRKTPLTHEQAVGELEKFSGIQFDPEIVPILVGLDRETAIAPARLGRDALPTMLDQEQIPRDAPEARDATRPCSPPTMFLSAIVLAIVAGALPGGGFPVSATCGFAGSGCSGWRSRSASWPSTAPRPDDRRVRLAGIRSSASTS